MSHRACHTMLLERPTIQCQHDHTLNTMLFHMPPPLYCATGTCRLLPTVACWQHVWGPPKPHGCRLPWPWSQRQGQAAEAGVRGSPETRVVGRGGAWTREHKLTPQGSSATHRSPTGQPCFIQILFPYIKEDTPFLQGSPVKIGCVLYNTNPLANEENAFLGRTAEVGSFSNLQFYCKLLVDNYSWIKCAM